MCIQANHLSDRKKLVTDSASAARRRIVGGGGATGAESYCEQNASRTATPHAKLSQQRKPAGLARDWDASHAEGAAIAVGPDVARRHD